MEQPLKKLYLRKNANNIYMEDLFRLFRRIQTEPLVVLVRQLIPFANIEFKKCGDNQYVVTYFQKGNGRRCFYTSDFVVFMKKFYDVLTYYSFNSIIYKFPEQTFYFPSGDIVGWYFNDY